MFIEKSGNTPIVDMGFGIYAKLELCNPTGSIKDRVIEYILNHALENNLINKDTVLVEASSGNTGISLASYGASFGLPVKIIMPSDMSIERRNSIEMYGAEIILVGPGQFDEAIRLRNEMCKEEGFFSTMQFENELNIQCHKETTGTEILLQLSLMGKKPKFLVAGTGTGGTLMGCSEKMKEMFPDLKVIAVEPMESPVMSGGESGLHKIQGIGDGSKFLVDLSKVDEIIQISDEDAIKSVRKLSKTYGYFAGISANANFLASKQISKKYNLSEDECIITFLCDRGQRYLSMLKE